MAKSTQRQRPVHPPARRPRPSGGGARGGGGPGRGGGGRPRGGGAGRGPSGRPWARVAIPGAVVVVIVAVLALVATSGGGGGKKTSSGPDRVAASATIVSQVNNVPAATFDQVGVVQGLRAPSAVKSTALSSGGKPEVLYLGDEWCPVCATERWPLAVALARFGTFSNLQLTKSSSTDSDPDTNTLSFTGSTYTSPYLAFDPIEMQDRNGNKLVPTPTAQLSLEQSLGATGVPFVDFAGKYVLNTASYNPGVLSGLTWQQIASDLAQPSDSQGRNVQLGIVGSANQLSAVLCKLTGGQPADVCTSTGVKVAAAALSSSG